MNSVKFDKSEGGNKKAFITGNLLSILLSRDQSLFVIVIKRMQISPI